MTIRSLGRLSFEELQRIEADLRARGYRPADNDSWGMRRYEYGTDGDPAPKREPAQEQGYSICWRN
jgi:hypothetical protein